MVDDFGGSMAEARQTETIWRGAAGPVSLPDAPSGTDQPDEPTGSPGATAQGLRWYCLQHKNFEGARARLDVIRAGFPLCSVHWPRVIVRPWRGNDVIEELFPGYLFVRFDVRRAGWSVISRKGGNLLGILGVREVGAPIPVPAGEIEKLIMRAGGIAGAIDGTGDEERERLAAEAAADDARRAAEVAAKSAPRRMVRHDEVTFLDREIFGDRSLMAVDRGKARVEVMMTWFGAERVAEIRRERLQRRASA